MSARYEIHDDGTSIIIAESNGIRSTIDPVDGQHLDDAVIGAIRQQSADIAALKDALAEEVAANEDFRKAGGARDDEDMPTFCARLIAERDRYRGQLLDCELALKMEHDLLREKRTDLAAPVAPGMFTAEEVDDAMAHRISEKYHGIQFEAYFSIGLGRDIIAAVRSELGPTLGLVTREEMERHGESEYSRGYRDGYG